MSPRATKKTKLAAEVEERLAKALPTPVVELDFDDAWQLLVATMLAAQSTDKLVNTVTPKLFARWATPAALAAADLEEVEQVVRSTGYYRQKAKAIVTAAQKLVADFDGVVPRDIDALVTLPGVARKTANVVIGCAYGLPTGVVVDTHVTRVSERLGLSTEKKSDQVEAELMRLFPRDAWIAMSHRLVLFGRYLCKAKSPQCASCPLNELCRAREAEPVGPWEARADALGALVPPRPVRAPAAG
ncbi:MAG: endonuclease III [Myxococcales bacterium]|nr:endonuclease III [Myxococcales bacterium]MCB9732789.1 endonuclease III [Deltaproteobacteria bacterium]